MADRVGDPVTDALPELEGLIGLPWPVAGRLDVSEVHTPLLEGYAGFYDPKSDEITISEDLDDLTIVHEASHAWFNGGLFADAGSSEGLADLYADLDAPSGSAGGREAPGGDVDAAVGVQAAGLAAARADRRRGDDAREQYGYDASWSLMERLHRRDRRGRDAARVPGGRRATNPYPGAGRAREDGGS